MGKGRRTHPNEDDPTGNQRLSVHEAARVLGISEDAVRMRVKRGTLEAEREVGRLHVFLTPDPTTEPTDRTDELINELHDRVRSLEDQLGGEREANRENRRIIAALTSRIPELPAASSERPGAAPETARGEPDREESPARLVEALSRAHRGRGGGGGSVAELVCACKERFLSACEGLPVDTKHEGKQYCVLHAPTVEKDLPEFRKAINEKCKKKDFHFCGVYFPEYESFNHATLERPAAFDYATFEQGATFIGATFKQRATFLGTAFKEVARFHRSTFMKEAIFRGTTFEGAAAFFRATFEREAEFTMATFMNRANFSKATFNKEAIFSEATFKEEGRFRSLRTTSRTVLNLRAAEIERPERISFHSTSLRPSAFVDVDAQEFDFTDVEWFGLPNGDELTLEEEIEAVEAVEPEKYKRPSSLRKLQRACRRLMNNAEKNRDYPTANEFHYWSMELLRKEGWSRLGLIATAYWALSGYGERPRRAFWVLVGMWTFFAILYMVCGAPELRAGPLAIYQFDNPSLATPHMLAGPKELPLVSASELRQSIGHVGNAFGYSLAAVARLVPQRLEPSDPGLFQVLVTLEGVLGPLQIALLALAVRRKVMR